MRTLLVLLPIIALLPGCATPPSFPEPDAQWKTFSGQLQYVTRQRSLIGEFVASQHAGDFRLDVTKGGAVPLIRVARHGEDALAEGALARGRWHGAAASAPAPLRGWVAEVPRAFARFAGRPAPARLEVPGGQAGEKFVFIFSR